MVLNVTHHEELQDGLVAVGVAAGDKAGAFGVGQGDEQCSFTISPRAMATLPAAPPPFNFPFERRAGSGIDGEIV